MTEIKKCGVDGCEQPIGRCTVHCPCGYPWDAHQRVHRPAPLLKDPNQPRGEKP